MRKHGRTDANHVEIVNALRQAGCSVQSLADVGGGCPDLLVGRGKRNFVIEVKDGSLSPSEKRLTVKESTWHNNWRGDVQIVFNVDDALKVLES